MSNIINQSPQLFTNIQIVPIEYSQYEIYAIQRLNIKETKAFNHFGYNHNLQFDQLVDYFKSLSSNIYEDCIIYSRLIFNLINLVSQIKSNTSCWLVIRSSIPNDDFKIPRFHKDGTYYSTKENEIVQKFILTIKGPGTLICEPSEQGQQKFDEVFYNTNNTFSDLEIREKLAHALIDEHIHQLTNNQGCFFTIGSDLKSSIHSEPNITQPRLFISILPGTFEQIEELRIRWNR